MKNLHQHSKKQSQVERLVLFSDAVFAIAMTLLITDLKIPELKGASISEHLFLEGLLSLLPKFLGVLCSFFIIGLYWFIHHRMFGYVVDCDGKLIWLNLVFLFSIVLMPFTTAVYSGYSTPETIYLIFPYFVYVANICLTGVLNYFMWGYIGNPKNELAENFPAGGYLQKAKIRSLLLPISFILSLIVCVVFNPIAGRFFLFLTPLIMSLVRDKKTIAKKYNL
jgi:uncharacterized membrane protein